MLARRGDGWLRFIPNEDRIHFKWKFTRGPWEGHYAYVCGYPGSEARMLNALIVQLAAIDGGGVKPAKDRLHSSYQ
jgi:hypothetical protein